MKRALALIFVTAACIAAFLSVRGTLPFMPIFGSSMEPTLQSGSLMVIEPIEPQDVEVGDIIVYSVPTMIQEYYSYPPTVAHRVITINTKPSLGFRTKGDNTGEDPFTIRPYDVRGTVGNQIPYLGLPLLFFQSQQGLIFTIIALALLSIFLYGGELTRGGNFLHRGIFAPVISEEKRSSRVLTRKIEATEQTMHATEDALEKFAAAVAEYAQHLASHTSAIQGLSEASHELKRGAAEQNRVLSRILEATGQPLPKTPAPPMTEAPISRMQAQPPVFRKEAYIPRAQAPEAEAAPLPRPQAPAPRATTPVQEEAKPANEALYQPKPAEGKTVQPSGCARRRPLTAEEILEKLRKPPHHAA